MPVGHGILALLLAVAAPGVTVPATAGAPPVAPGAELRADAREASQAGRHAEAAKSFESLWSQHKDPADLFDAASARLAAGHRAHAAAHLRVLLDQPALPPGRRAEAEAMLGAARAGLVPVTLDVWLVDEGTVRDAAVAEYEAGEGGGSRPLLEVSIAGSGRRYTRVIELDPGDWQLLANTTKPVTVRARAGHPVRIRLEVVPEDNESRRKKFSLGVAAFSAPGLVAGSVLMIFAPRGLGARGPLDGDCDADNGVYPTATCRSHLRRHTSLVGIGGGMFGWSAGMLTGGLLGLLGDHRRRRTAWFSTLALGGAALVGGVVLTSLGARRFNEFNGAANTSPWTDPAYQAGVSRGANMYLAGGPILGLGVGLLVSSIAGLAAEYCHGFSHGKLQRCAALRGSIRPDAATLTIGGAF